MTFVSKSKIVGLGAYVPERRVLNSDFEKILDTNDEWIVQRTGIRERRFVAEDQYASELAIRAVENLFDHNPQAATVKIDMIVVTTFTPDYHTPTVSALVQKHFGFLDCGVIDLSAGCTGFMYGLTVADALITSGHSRSVLVIATEALSKMLDLSDRNTAILFGDGAAAGLLERTDGEGSFIASYFSTDGDKGVNITAGNLAFELDGVTLKEESKIEQNGHNVYRYVNQQVPKGIEVLMEKATLSFDEIDWFVPHSANMRMVESLCHKMHFPLEKTLTSLEYYGNTSSSSIPLALWEAWKNPDFKKEGIYLLYGFGGGLTHGGVIIRF